MLGKIKSFFRKRADVVSYLFFGVLTTFVNYIIYYPLYNLAGSSAALSNIIAWIASVIFAFVTNKPFVFKSHDWSAEIALPEFVRFVGCRLGSGLLETVAILVTVDWLCWNGNVMKLLVSILVVILNYVSSRMIVFKKK